MATIDSISAYAAYAASSYVSVSPAQPVSTYTSSSANSKRVIEDKVTLSDTAQAYLEQLARSGDLESARSASIGHGNLVGADLSGKNYSGTDLSSAFLFRANLAGTDFSYATLKDAWLAQADVTGADFRKADLRGANLSGVTGLTPEQLTGATVDLSTVLPFTVVYDG